MHSEDLMKLKSGTDIRGTALTNEGNEVNLTPAVAERVGRSFAYWLRKKKDSKEDLTVAVGNDPRLSGEQLKEHLIRGLVDSGVVVYDCGLASTPAMFMSTVLPGHQYTGAVMITASHLPRDKNGFKFFTAEGGLESDNIVEILEIAAGKKYETSDSCEEKGEVRQVDLIDDYSQYIVEKVRDDVSTEVKDKKPLSNFHIIVNAGNGAGGFFAEHILQPLGADTTGSQFLDPDGHFPHHIPNPENEKAMEFIKEAVRKSGADLGIIFDTDVDRAAVVDNEGKAINRNRLIALAAAIVLEEHPGATIVTDSVTSKGLNSFIEEKLGGVHHRFKRGYKNVINEAKGLNKKGKNAPLAIETSGHAAFRENYFLDDGAYLVAKILIKMAILKIREGRNLKDLITDLEEPEISKEFRMKIKRSQFKVYGICVLEQLKDFVDSKPDWQIAPRNYEGVRVNCGKQDWFLLRLSLHDPVLVLNVECNSKENLIAILDSLAEFMDQFKDVDSKGITKNDIELSK